MVGLVGILITDVVMGLPRTPAFDPAFHGAPRASPWYLRYASRGAESAHGQGRGTLLADETTQTTGDREIKDLSHTLVFVLDEHLGVNALPDTIAETKALKEKLKNFYTAEGFDLYANAYSNYYYTEDAISNTLNNTYLDQRAGHFPDFNKSEHVYRLKKNALFNLFAQRNFALRAYQTSFLDVCHGENEALGSKLPSFPAKLRRSLDPPSLKLRRGSSTASSRQQAVEFSAEANEIEACFEYPHNWLRAVLDPAYTFRERLWVVFSEFVITNSFVRELNGGTVDNDWLKTRTGPLQTFPAVLNRIQNDIVNASHNTLFFAHILMPHYPYIYDAACKPRPVADWKNRREFHPKTEQEIRQAAEDRYRLYAEQTGCLNKELDDFFDALKAANLYDSTQIIFYGDHGTKILHANLPTETSAQNMSADELKDSYATLFATKPKGQTHGHIMDDPRDTVDLIWSALGEKSITPPKPTPFVFVRKDGSKKELVAFPAP
jgi:hypothetical protein